MNRANNNSNVFFNHLHPFSVKQSKNLALLQIFTFQKNGLIL